MQVRNTAWDKEDLEKFEAGERHEQLSKVESNGNGQVWRGDSDDCGKSDPTSSCTSTEMATKVSKN